MKLTMSAPGKVLLAGSYTSLEQPNPALVLSVDARVRVEIETLKGSKIKFHTPKKKLRTAATWDGKALKLENHSAYFKFVKNATEVVLHYLTSIGMPTHNFSLRTENDPAFSRTHKGVKTGLGSSAAVTASTVAAVLKLHDTYTPTVAYHLTQVAHSQTQERIGSGFDVAAACYGTLKYYRYSESILDRTYPNIATEAWDCLVHPLSVPEELKIVLGATGKKADTVELVKKVLTYKEEHPIKGLELWNALRDANASAVESFSKQDWGTFRESYHAAQHSLRELGEAAAVVLVHEHDMRLSTLAEQAGAIVAGQAGAGGGDSLVALALTKEDKENVVTAWEKEGLKILDVQLEEGGIRNESDRTNKS